MVRNRLFQARPKLVNIKSNQSLYFPFIVSVNNCCGSCNTSDPYAPCALNKVNNINVKVLFVMLGVNETRFLVQHKSCECKCDWMKI